MGVKNYILAHKDFTIDENKLGVYPHLKDYFVLTQKPIQTNLPNQIVYDGLDNRMYGEFSVWKWIYENHDWDKDDVVGLHHYRRIVEYPYHSIAVVQPMRFGCSVLEQTKHYHGNTVNNLLSSVLKPQEYNILNRPIFFAYNLFSCNKELLGKWLEFVGDKLNTIADKINVHSLEEMHAYIQGTDLLDKLPNKNTDIDYQSRLYATICERLNTIFWQTMVNNYLTANIQLMEVGQTI